MSDFFQSSKGINPLITAIFVLAITISGIVLVLNIGAPIITKAKENSLFTESKQNLKVVGNLIDAVTYGGEGTARKVNLDVTDGSYLFNRTSDKIIFTYDMDTDLLPVGLCDKTGNLKIKTYGVGRVLDLSFEEGSGNTTEDCSRHENNGILKPNQTYGPNWTSSCKFGKCLSFDGVDDYVDVGNDSSLNQGKITILAWINTPTPTTAWQMITVKGSGADSTGEYRLGFYTTSGRSFIRIFVGGTTYYIIGSVLSADTWYFLAATYNGETLKLYENGNLVDSDTSPSGNLENHGQVLYIGKRKDGYYFNGTIDEVRIYNRALSAETIKKLYKGGPTGRARKLEITLDPGNVNITNQVRFGKGSHQIFVKNKGYSNGETQIQVSRL